MIFALRAKKCEKWRFLGDFGRANVKRWAEMYRERMKRKRSASENADNAEKRQKSSSSSSSSSSSMNDAMIEEKEAMDDEL